MHKPAYERFKTYNKPHCWQYQIRLSNLQKDLTAACLTQETAADLRCNDFEFNYVLKTDIKQCQEIKQFIENNEYLGTIPNRPTHRFVARCFKNNILAGAEIFAVPNTFSYILGKEYKHKEKLISRGACISWSPKNLASWLLARSINWMIKNTEFRIFTAYADVEAKELGTIYQALNFYYLGQNSGTIKQYFDPQKSTLGWHSDRTHRAWSAWHRYARELGYGNLFKDHPGYCNRYCPNWSIIPQDIKKALKEKQKQYTTLCQIRHTKPKHKYVLLKGINKTETNFLQNLFAKLNPGLYNNRYNYPKSR